MRTTATILASEGYTIRTAAKVTGANSRTLQRWVAQGVITPSMHQPVGRGDWAIFSFNDLVAFRTAQRLRANGIPLQRLKKALANLRQADASANLSNTVLVSDGRDIFAKSGAEMRSLLRKPGQVAFVWAIPLAEVEAEIREALRRAA